MLCDESTPARPNVTGLPRVQRGQDIVGFESKNWAVVRTVAVG